MGKPKKAKCSKCGGENTTFASSGGRVKDVYLCHDCVVFFVPLNLRKES